MAEQKRIRVAIIGYGLAGAVFHAPLIAATPGLAVTAIVTRDAVRKEQASKDFPQARLLDTADSIWSDPASCDLAVVAAPNRVHASLGEASLEAGIPVVIDKPFATTVAEARRLIEVSKSTGTMLTVFQNRRWDNDFLTVQKLLVEDLLGQITRFESRMDRYRPAPRPGSWRESVGVEEGGGLLFDLGSHLIDQALALFGHPKSVYAEVDIRRPASQVDDDTFIALQFGSGVRAHLWMSYVARSAGPRFRVMGLRGTYEKWGVDPQEEALRSGRRPPELNWGRENEESWGRLHSDIDGAEFDAAWESLPGDYPRFYGLVRDAILNGTPPPVDPLEALMTMKVIEAARQSSLSGQCVQF